MAGQTHPLTEVSIGDLLDFEPLKTAVWVTHRFVAFHRWPNAPRGREYLAMPHRHLFHVRCEVEVLHDDRDIEFHDLLDVVIGACPEENIGATSCEQAANWIASHVRQRWPGRSIICEVSEDGECGARVET